MSLFRNFYYCLSLGRPKPKIVIADADLYSISTLRCISKLGIIPLINSQKNISRQNVTKLGSHLYINLDFIPPNWTGADSRCLYSVRTSIEEHFHAIFSFTRLIG
ncbi:MAG: hypothetical protein ACTSRA_20700 [Promethearchaeota archaeon]